MSIFGGERDTRGGENAAGICNIYNTHKAITLFSILYFLPSIDYHNLMKFHVSCPVSSLHFIFHWIFISLFRFIRVHNISHTEHIHMCRNFRRKETISKWFSGDFFRYQSEGVLRTHIYLAFVKLSKHKEIQSFLRWIFMPFWACNIVTQNVYYFRKYKIETASLDFSIVKRKTRQ